MTADDETDHLLRRWHDGDREALVSLVERDRHWVFARVRQSRGAALQRFAETHDDFQDLMLRALQYAPRFRCRDRSQFRALIARMIGNLLVDRARAQAVRQDLRSASAGCDSRLDLDQLELTATGPDEAAARGEELAWMRIGLEFLDADERDVIWRRMFDEQGFAEIAAATGTSGDAVRMRHNRALLRLAGIVQRLQSGGLAQLLQRDASAGQDHA